MAPARWLMPAAAVVVVALVAAGCAVAMDPEQAKASFDQLSPEEQAMAKKQQEDLQNMFKQLEGKDEQAAQAIVKSFTPEQQQLLKSYHEYRQQQNGGGGGGAPGGGQPQQPGQPERPPTPQEQQQMLKAIFAQLEGKSREEQNTLIEKLPKIQKELLDRYNEYQFDQQQKHIEKEKKRLGFCSDKEVYPKVGPRSYDYSSPNLEKCTQISLWDDELEDDGALALAKAIKGHDNFVGLSLDTTGIGAVGAAALAAAVEGSDVFQSLDLDGNSVGNAGAIALANALESCKAMQVLNLAHNDVGNEGAEALVNLVKRHRGIIQLGFHGNLASPQITKLLKNLVESNALEAVRKAEAAKNATEAAKALEDDGEPIEEVEEEPVDEGEPAQKDEL